MYNNGNSSKNVTGSSVVDGTLENEDFADDTLSGDKIDGGIVSNFQSTGIDDRLASGKALYTKGTNVGVSTSNPIVPLEIGALKAQRWQTGSTTLDLTPTAGGIDQFVFNTSQNALIDFKMGGTTKASITSGGITFNGDTAAANALDDYEEGIWTPSFSSTSATWSYAVQYGSYVKVGGLVQAQFYINATASGTTSNSAFMVGLPFSSENLNASHQNCVGLWFSGAVDPQPLLNNNSTVVTIWLKGGVSQATAAEISGNYFVGTVTYRAS